MDKYTLLILLNIPFVLVGLVRASELHHKKIISRSGLIIRVAFWLLVLTGLIFVEPVYRYLFVGGLTDSDPMSIIDVVLITSVLFSLSIITRLYSRVEALERKLTDFHEKISVLHSNKKQK